MLNSSSRREDPRVASRVRRSRWGSIATLLYPVLALIVVMTPAARGQAPLQTAPSTPRTITAADVAAACGRTSATDTSGTARLCRAPVFTVLDTSRASRIGVIPGAEQVLDLARSTTAPGITPIQSGGIPGAALTPSDVAWGLTDYVLEQAGAQLEDWLIQRFAGRLCRRDPASVFLPETCRILAAANAATLVLGPALLQATSTALRKDALGLPVRFLDWVAKQGHAAPNDVATVKVAVQFLLGVAGGSKATVEHRLTLGSIPSDHQTTIAAGLYRSALAFVAVAPWPGQTDTVRASELRALLVNANARTQGRTVDGTFESVWPDSGSAEAERRIGVVANAAELNEIPRQMAALRRLPTNTPQSRTERRDTIDKLVEEAWYFLSEANPAAAARIDSLGLAEPIKDMIKAIAREDFGTALIGTIRVGARLGAQWSAGSHLARLAGFIADAAQVKDAASVKRLLVQYAAPPATYMAERSRFSLDVVTRLGVRTGTEYTATPSGRGGAWFWAVHLPVGLQVSIPIGSGWSLGVFGQALDLGALANWRLSGGGGDPAVGSQPVVGFRQLVSWGGFVVLGLRNMPFSAGAGYSFTPSLRSLKSASGADAGKTRAAQASLLVSVDVPLFRFLR
jgi:hypothetical protein